MTDDTAVQFRNQRYGQGLSGAQGLYDELLRVVADLKAFERSNCDFGYRTDIGVSLVSDNHAWIRGVHVRLPYWPTMFFVKASHRFL
jgi:hypothetical protein